MFKVSNKDTKATPIIFTSHRSPKIPKSIKQDLRLRASILQRRTMGNSLTQFYVLKISTQIWQEIQKILHFSLGFTLNILTDIEAVHIGKRYS